MKRTRPAFYATVHLLLVAVARDNGYALGLHGSMQRDLDLIACPWTEDAVSADALIRAMAKAVAGYVNGKPAKRPHGRVAYALVIDSDLYVDVSVMPRR